MWSLLLATVSLALPPAVVGRVETGAKNEGDVALVVANKDYGTLPVVDQAENDATGMYTWLTSARGIPENRVRVVKNGSSVQIREALAEATKLVGKDGTLWVYYSGHGASSAAKGDRVILGVDVVDAKTVDELGIGLAELEAAAAASPAARSLVIVDAAFSGYGRNALPVVNGASFSPPAPKAPASDKVTVWTAVEQSQLAYPMKQSPHGAFSYFLLGALRGWADGEGGAPDGKVTLGEAQAYVRRGLVAVGLKIQTPTIETRGGPKGWALTEGTLEEGPDVDKILEMEIVEGDLLGLLSGQDSGIARNIMPEIEELAVFQGPIQKQGGKLVDKKGKVLGGQQLKALAGLLPDGKIAINKKQGTAITGIVGGILTGALAIPGIPNLAQTLKLNGAGEKPTTANIVLSIGVPVAALGATLFPSLSAIAGGKQKGKMVDFANKSLGDYEKRIAAAAATLPESAMKELTGRVDDKTAAVVEDVTEVLKKEGLKLLKKKKEKEGKDKDK